MIMDHAGKSVVFFYPSLKKFESLPILLPEDCGTEAVSITGQRCQLNCKHCGGTILKNMKIADTPSTLKKAAERTVAKGGRTILISGGSDKKGQVPLLPFIPAIQEIRSKLGLRILVHTGLVSNDLAVALADAGVEMALLDIIGDNQTIRDIYHLEASVEDYGKSLEFLTERGVPVAPHVIMGLYYGKIRGESLALEMIARYPIKTLVLIGFRPIPNTALAGTVPPTPEEMGDLFGLARSLFPETPVVLGCERPLGLHLRRLDELALAAGLDGITYPADQTIQTAKERGLKISFQTHCCALINA